MIRYDCPHCGRRCESADVLRGFPVICLGCRRSIRVPERSTIADDSPFTTTSAVPRSQRSVAAESMDNSTGGTTLASVEVSELRPDPPTRDFAIPQPQLGDPRPVATSHSPPPPTTRIRQGTRSLRRRWGVLALLAGVVVLLLVALILLTRRSPKLSEGSDETAQRAVRIRENFTPTTLQKIEAKHPSWRFAPVNQPKLKGKWVILSTDTFPEPTTFWERLLARWPVAPEAWRDRLIHDLWQQGKVDDLMFELNSARWAEGFGELDLIVGIHWWKEPVAIYHNDQSMPVHPSWLTNLDSKDLRLSLRWRAVAYVLERSSSSVIAWRVFEGLPPSKPPTENRKQVVGPRPAKEVLDWLNLLDVSPRPPSTR